MQVNFENYPERGYGKVRACLPASCVPTRLERTEQTLSKNALFLYQNKALASINHRSIEKRDDIDSTRSDTIIQILAFIDGLIAEANL